MRTSTALTALSLSLFSSLPTPVEAGSNTLDFTSSFARDVRTTWHGLRARAHAHSSLFNSQRERSHMIKRADNSNAKCVLRPAKPVLVGGGGSGNSSVPSPSTATSPASSSSSASVSAASSLRTSTSTRASGTTSTKGASPTSSSSSSSSPSVPSSIFNLKQVHNGSSFFDGWDFWSTGDPTHGMVDYQDSASAWSSGLVQINDAGRAIMRVDTTPVVSGNRKSIRIHSKDSFNGGLLVTDLVHMPGSICGTWPAFWSNGPNWPNNGEIDIVEGVHASTQNLMSLHTRSGCSIAKDYGAVGVQANTGPQGLNCAADETGNTGCGLRSSTANNYGTPFNNNGGGVYAMLWDDSGIRVFFFDRNSIPADLAADRPLPETWGTPQARWPASACNPYEFNKDHIAIFDTTLCGDWAGAQSSWTGTNYAGQGPSCASITGAPTCADFIRNNGGAFADAYWEVNYVKLFV